MAFRDRSQNFPSLTDMEYGSVVEVDFDSFEPCLSPNYGRSVYVSQRRSRPRLTLLVDEPRRLYNAMSFLTCQTGLCFNAHVTLTASSLGFDNYAHFLALMPHWHKEMNRCLFDGWSRAAEQNPRGGRTFRVLRLDLMRVEHPHYWVAGVEYARDQGVHVHVLCVVPKQSAKAFEEKTWSWWRKKSPGEAQANGIAFRIRHPLVAKGRYERQVELLRYVVKSTDERAIILGRKRTIVTARQIFRPYPNDCTPVQIEAGQLCGITHRLSEAEQKRAGFVSRFDDGRFEEIYSGWEIGEPEWREVRRQQRAFLEQL